MLNNERNWISNQNEHFKHSERFFNVFNLLIALFISLFPLMMYFLSAKWIFIPMIFIFIVIGAYMVIINRWVYRNKMPLRIEIGSDGIRTESGNEKYNLFIPWNRVINVRSDRWIKGYDVYYHVNDLRKKIDGIPVTKEIGERILRMRPDLSHDKSMRVL